MGRAKSHLANGPLANLLIDGVGFLIEHVGVDDLGSLDSFGQLDGQVGEVGEGRLQFSWRLCGPKIAPICRQLYIIHTIERDL